MNFDSSNCIQLLIKTVELREYLAKMTANHAAVRVITTDNPQLDDSTAWLPYVNFSDGFLNLEIHVMKNMEILDAAILSIKAHFMAVYLYSEWQVTHRDIYEIADKYFEYTSSDDYNFDTDIYVIPFIHAFYKFYKMGDDEN